MLTHPRDLIALPKNGSLCSAFPTLFWSLGASQGFMHDLQVRVLHGAMTHIQTWL